MEDPMDMTDEEFWLYQARQSAAKVYRFEGFPAFAERLARGLEDDCSQVRLARFFIEPPAPHDTEYEAAWKEASAREAA